jgi:hypothetical protein
MNQSSEDKKPKIFIGGDSWGCGEWDINNLGGYDVTHKGLEQYFLDLGYTVLNSSKPSGSNKESIKKLSHSLIDYVKNDLIFWIQTDSIRDLKPYSTLTEDIVSSGGLDILLNTALDQNYLNLNSIAQKLDLKIYLIGGMQDLNLNNLKKYSNLIPIMPSWVHLLAGHFTEYKDLFPQHTATDSLIRYIDKKLMSTELFYQTIDILYAIDQNLKIFREEIFHPDGRHPNRDGHKILFDYLIKELKL